MTISPNHPSAGGRVAEVPAAATVLTARQRRILRFIADYARENGYAPTVREIGKAVGLKSSSSIQSQLSVLQQKGLIRKDPTKPRTIVLVEEEAE